jgi:predicted GNAT family acetyltransferase
VSNPPQVTDNQAESRFEADAGGHRAELLYRRNGNRLVLIHTEVPVEAEAIDRAARDGMTVVPLCPFARSWLERHPDVANRAAIDWG